MIVAAIAGARGGGADGDVVLYRSVDRGRTWSPSIVINDVPGAAREGLHALAANDAGLVVVAWLDLRDKGTRVYAATSRDHGATWSPDALVYASPSGSICECCHPSVAIDDGGGVAVLFRNHVDGRRDMYVVRSRDGATFGPAVKQGTRVVAAGRLSDGRRRDRDSRRDGPHACGAARRRSTPPLRQRELRPAAPRRRSATAATRCVAIAGGRIDAAWTGAAGVQLRQHGRAPLALGPGGFASLLAFPDRTVAAIEHQGRVAVHVVASASARRAGRSATHAVRRPAGHRARS